MTKLKLTLHATVDADEFADFYADHRDMEDLAASFSVRLDEVFGNGGAELTTVYVESVDVENIIDGQDTLPLETES